MRQIVIDELSPFERDNLDSYLKRTLIQGPMVGLFWLQIPQELLSEKQLLHTQCAPYYLAVELDNCSLRIELLVRSTTTLHCDCIAYTTEAQRQFALNFMDTMLREEMIRA